MSYSNLLKPRPFPTRADFERLIKEERERFLHPAPDPPMIVSPQFYAQLVQWADDPAHELHDVACEMLRRKA